MELSVPVGQGPVQHVGAHLQEKMGALRAPPHLLFLAHAVIHEVVHNRFDVRCGDTPAGRSGPREIGHSPTVAADIASKVADGGVDSLARVATMVAPGPQSPGRVTLEPT
jgi:hypothetical protein